MVRESLTKPFGHLKWLKFIPCIEFQEAAASGNAHDERWGETTGISATDA